MQILNTILEYENGIFQQYLLQRSKMLETIHSIRLDTLSKQQRLHFIHDVKSIIDPLKTSISSIDDFIKNSPLFENKSSLQQNNDLLKMIVYFFLLTASSSEEELDISELDVSSSELSSSVSVSSDV